MPGILPYLRLRAELERSPKTTAITMRAVVEDLHGLFGCYCAASVSKKTNANGDIETTLGLSRLTSTLLRPAVDDFAKAIDDWDLGLQEGRAAGAGKGGAVSTSILLPEGWPPRGRSRTSWPRSVIVGNTRPASEVRIDKIAGPGSGLYPDVRAIPAINRKAAQCFQTN